MNEDTSPDDMETIEDAAEKIDDELDQAIFDYINHLRKQGYTFREIVPRLRDLADYCEDHAERFDRWDDVVGNFDGPLPGDYDDE